MVTEELFVVCFIHEVSKIKPNSQKWRCIALECGAECSQYYTLYFNNVKDEQLHAKLCDMPKMIFFIKKGIL